MPISRRKVIVVTDGDRVAGRTVQVAAKNINARFISLTTGNPTPISAQEVVKLIKETPSDPVVIMVDDRGEMGSGRGEHILKYVSQDPEIEILGAIAVASNAGLNERIKVDKSIARNGKVVAGPVDKLGNPERSGNEYLEGDTIEVLNRIDLPVIIGTGDTGKMDFADDYHKGAPITTKALREILNRGDRHGGNSKR